MVIGLIFNCSALSEQSCRATLMAPVFAQQLAAACSMIAIPDEPAPQEQPKETPQPPGNAPPPEPRNDS